MKKRNYLDISALVFAFIIIGYVLFKEYYHVTYSHQITWPPSITFVPELVLYGGATYFVLWKLKDYAKQIYNLKMEKQMLREVNDRLSDELKQIKDNMK